MSVENLQWINTAVFTKKLTKSMDFSASQITSTLGLQTIWSASEKMFWIDIPTHVCRFFNSFKYLVSVSHNLTDVKVAHMLGRARVGSHEETSVGERITIDEFKVFMQWVLEHRGHVFTYYSSHSTDHETRWRMTKKPYVYKSYNNHAKGLASTIQSNQFYVNSSMFGEASVKDWSPNNPSHEQQLTYKSWIKSVLVNLPEVKMESLMVADKDMLKLLSSRCTMLEDDIRNADDFPTQLRASLAYAIECKEVPTSYFSDGLLKQIGVNATNPMSVNDTLMEIQSYVLPVYLDSNKTEILAMRKKLEMNVKLLKNKMMVVAMQKSNAQHMLTSMFPEDTNDSTGEE